MNAKPHTYRDLFASLQDDMLYSCSQLASMVVVREHYPDDHRRIRKAVNAIMRRYLLQEGGDDVIYWEGKQVPAWEGRSWKQVLKSDPLDRPLFPPPRTRGKQPIHRMKYDCLILALDPFELYTPQAIVSHGLKEECAIFKGVRSQRDLRCQKAANSLHQYRKRRLPVLADGIFRWVGADERVRWRSGWWGWRWQLSLPDSVVSPAAKRALHERVQRMHGSSTSQNIKLRGQRLQALSATANLGVSRGAAWLAYHDQISRQWQAKRQAMFQQWFPPVVIEENRHWPLAQLAAHLEQRYGIRFRVPLHRQQQSLRVAIGQPWQDVLADNDLSWRVEASGHVAIQPQDR